MVKWNTIRYGIKTTTLDLGGSKISFFTDNIRKDVSLTEFTRSSKFEDRRSTAESYTPEFWGDILYDEIFTAMDSIVNPYNILQADKRWLMKYTNGQYTKPHNHEEWDYVAIYYLSAPTGSGALVFPEYDIRIYPHTGLIVFHDAKIIHAVEPNTVNNIERFCAVLNYRKPRVSN